MTSPASRLALLSSLLHKVQSIPIQNETLPTTGFTIHQIANPHFVANGSLHLQAAYAKYQGYSINHAYNIKLGNTSSNWSTSSPYSVVTTPAIADSEYVAPVTIAGQELVVNFDTGSADL